MTAVSGAASATFPLPAAHTRLHLTVEARSPRLGAGQLCPLRRQRSSTARRGNRSVRAGGNPLVSGTILQQSTNGSFSDSNLTGPGVFEVTALGPTGPTAQSQVGVFDASGGTDNSI